MSQDMRLVSIELENFRQYFGKHKIDFSSRDKGFTVIAGKNGEGKSNLLNAISWCLYHKEPHGSGEDVPSRKSENKSLPVINNKYIIELPEEKIATTSVKIWIKKGEDTYSVSRILSVLKHKLEFKKLSDGREVLLLTDYASDRVPKGCEILNEDYGEFVIKRKGPHDADFHDTIKEGDPITILEEILPENLSKYFLLDGEFLEGFWKNPSIIQNGVEQISQLHLLSSLLSHLDKVRIAPKGYGKETDSLTSKIQILTWFEQSLDEDGIEKFSEEIRWKKDPEEEDLYYHASGKPRIDDLTDDKKRMEDRLKEISAEISRINIPNLKLVKENYKSKKDALDKIESDMNELAVKYQHNLITKSPYVFLKEAINDSIKIIEARIELGDLPIRQRRQFAEDLLTKGSCICGESLNSKIVDDVETNKHRVNIEFFRDDLVGKDDLDTAVDMRYDFKHDFIDQYDSFLKEHFGTIRTQLTKFRDRYDELNFQVKGISTQLKNSGDIGIEKLFTEQEYLLEQINIIAEKIGEIKIKLALNNKEKGEANGQLTKRLKENDKASKLTFQLEKWNSMYDHVKKVYDDLKIQIRKNVQDNTWKNYKELLSNSSEFKDFSIEDDYSVYLLDHHNVNKIRDLSAGQSLILTMAFVAALREPTGYKFPLVIDSPLGKIDGGNRYNIAKKLPEYLPGEQLTLLVTDTEYAADLPADPDNPDLPKTPFGKILEEQIPLQHFKIQKDKTGENVGNSTIKPAKLEFENEQNRWMVVVDE